MYSMVMMMAVASSGDAASFHKKGGSCSGYSCSGSVVVESYSCSGYSCSGGSKHGGGFLGGLKGKLGGKHSCHGSSCHGSTACHGSYPMSYSVPTYTDACALPGAPVMTPPGTTAPKTMPKTEDMPKKKES